MHPIGGATAVKWAIPRRNANAKGTVVSAEWLNTIQDEIINAIKSAGIQINSQDNDEGKNNWQMLLYLLYKKMPLQI